MPPDADSKRASEELPSGAARRRGHAVDKPPHDGGANEREASSEPYIGDQKLAIDALVAGARATSVAAEARAI